MSWFQALESFPEVFNHIKLKDFMCAYALGKQFYLIHDLLLSSWVSVNSHFEQKGLHLRIFGEALYFIFLYVVVLLPIYFIFC